MAIRLRLNHMAIQVRDKDVSAEFYGRVLRLPEIAMGGTRAHVRWFAIGPDTSIHLIQGDFGSTQVKRSTHYCIASDDLAGSIRHLDREGVAYCDYDGIPGKIAVRADGVKSVYLQDPDGYWIEISEDY